MYFLGYACATTAIVCSMPKLPAALSSLTALERTFAEGLATMLAQHHGLGVYILVLANTAYDAALWARLGAPLALRHAELAASVTRMPARNSDLSPAFSIARVMALPPPWTTTT